MGPEDPPWYKRAFSTAVDFVNYVGDGISNAVTNTISDFATSSGYQFGQTYSGDGTIEGDFEAEFNNASQALVDALPEVAGELAADATLLVLFEAGGATLQGMKGPAKISSIADDAADAVTTLKPGPFASKSVPARGKAQTFTSGERNQINAIGAESGCHTCGAKVAGTKSGNFVPDHQPVSALVPNGTPQSLYPHCIGCSRSQGGTVSQIKRKNGSK